MFFNFSHKIHKSHWKRELIMMRNVIVSTLMWMWCWNPMNLSIWRSEKMKLQPEANQKRRKISFCFSEWLEMLFFLNKFLLPCVINYGVEKYIYTYVINEISYVLQDHYYFSTIFSLSRQVGWGKVKYRETLSGDEKYASWQQKFCQFESFFFTYVTYGKSSANSWKLLSFT